MDTHTPPLQSVFQSFSSRPRCCQDLLSFAAWSVDFCYLFSCVLQVDSFVDDLVSCLLFRKINASALGKDAAAWRLCPLSRMTPIFCALGVEEESVPSRFAVLSASLWKGLCCNVTWTACNVADEGRSNDAWLDSKRLGLRLQPRYPLLLSLRLLPNLGSPLHLIFLTLNLTFLLLLLSLLLVLFGGCMIRGVNW